MSPWFYQILEQNCLGKGSDKVVKETMELHKKVVDGIYITGEEWMQAYDNAYKSSIKYVTPKSTKYGGVADKKVVNKPTRFALLSIDLNPVSLCTLILNGEILDDNICDSFYEYIININS